MPVWHDALKEWVESGELVLVGLTQEQHPERCRLFAQWQGFDFPILWDPFNLTGSKVVPSFIAIDEHGVVRSTRPSVKTFEEEFLLAEFDAPAAAEPVPASESACAFTDSHHFATPWSTMLAGGSLDEGVAELERDAATRPEDPVAAFRAGVARRLRYDSSESRPEDFQLAIDHWTRALRLDPNQYIWRRRIQQYGPRMDKPYPFYAWVEEAQREITARGETPIALVAELTPAELAQPRSAEEAGVTRPTPPDPKGEIRRDADGLIALETAVAFDTSGSSSVATVHLALRPNAARDAHWNHEAGPTIALWVERPGPQLLEVAPRTDVATSAELEPLTFEVTLPDGEDAAQVAGYALYYVCEGAAGTCLYLRQDFALEVRRPDR